MAKDPAVLWYYTDYLNGTEHMSFAEQGAYARLLNKQADTGHFSLQFAKNILKKDFGKIWPSIKSKFLEDSEGLFFNERMDIEIEKRRRHSQRQSENSHMRWDKRWDSNGISQTDPNRMPLGNRNEDCISGDSLKGGIVQDMNLEFKKRFPKYPQDQEKDFPALFSLACKIGEGMKISKADVVGLKRGEVLKRWGELIDFVKTDRWFSTRSISDLLKEFQRLIQTFETANPVKNLTRTEVESQIELRERQNAKLEKKYGQ